MNRKNLNFYGYRRKISFNGLMDKIANIIGTVGASGVNVQMHGADGNGEDALEVMDISKAFSEKGPEPTENGDFLATDFNNDFYLA